MRSGGGSARSCAVSILLAIALAGCGGSSHRLSGTSVTVGPGRNVTLPHGWHVGKTDAGGSDEINVATLSTAASGHSCGPTALRASTGPCRARMQRSLRSGGIYLWWTAGRFPAGIVPSASGKSSKTADGHAGTVSFAGAGDTACPGRGSVSIRAIIPTLAQNGGFDRIGGCIVGPKPTTRENTVLEVLETIRTRGKA